MRTSLTLSIDQDVMENVEKYAREQKRSVSKLVEEYLSSICASPASPLMPSLDKRIEYDALGPITKELAGIIKVDKHAAYKDILTDALMEKYI